MGHMTPRGGVTVAGRWNTSSELTSTLHVNHEGRKEFSLSINMAQKMRGHLTARGRDGVGGKEEAEECSRRRSHVSWDQNRKQPLEC